MNPAKPKAIHGAVRAALYIGAAQRWLKVLCVTAAAISLSACMQLDFLTVNAAASFSEFSRRTDVAYGKLPADRLDIYLPAHADHCPIVVFFYGGGWKSGDKASYKFVGAALAAGGIITVIPNYRLYPRAKFPAFMHDAARAVAWTRMHARQWGGDPAQLYLVGHSSGAYIAVMLALNQDYLRRVGGCTQWLRGVVGLAGPYDFLPFTDGYLKDLFGPPANFPSSQPINYVRPGAPPLLLMQGLRDKTVSPSNTRSLAAAMRRVGGTVMTQYFKSAGHAELVAAFSILQRKRLPVLREVRAFIASGAAAH
ncbi:MAG TPA: alpha/beta hydrolase [Steroidobacteraceae bacterium]